MLRKEVLEVRYNWKNDFWAETGDERECQRRNRFFHNNWVKWTELGWVRCSIRPWHRLSNNNMHMNTEPGLKQMVIIKTENLTLLGHCCSTDSLEALSHFPCLSPWPSLSYSQFLSLSVSISLFLPLSRSLFTAISTCSHSYLDVSGMHHRGNRSSLHSSKLFMFPRYGRAYLACAENLAWPLTYIETKG